MRVAITKSMLLTENVDVARSDVPFLTGLDLLDKYQMMVNKVDILHFRNFRCDVPLIRKRGHIYLEWMHQDRILYPYSELIKLYRIFSNPHTDKLIF